MAVRVETAENIELVHWERTFEGTYTSKTKTKDQSKLKPKKMLTRAF